MKRILPLIIIAHLFSIGSFAQSNQGIVRPQKTWIRKDAQCLFPSATLSGNNNTTRIENAQVYLKTSVADLKNENSGLNLSYSRISPYADYYGFVQTFRDYEIFGTSIKIGIDKENKIISVITKTGDVSAWPGNVTIPDPDLAQLKAAAGNCDRIEWKKSWYYEENAGIPAYVVNCDNNDGSRSDLLVVNSSTYDIIYSKSLIKNYKYPDSLATLFVFYPDPLTSAKVPYGWPYTNHNDSDVAVLDSQMVPKQMRVSVISDSFFLENQYVRETDLAPPHNDPTYSKTPVFHYTRNQSSFRDIMIYYHLNRWREHLAALGFDSLGPKQITVDPSGLYDDNSNFEHPGGNPMIWFGIGGIPDAEDADVPTHEYTHFLSWSACPGCSESGQEREALDEGTADYFAASNSKDISTFNWEKIYNWDGNIGGWNGRSCAVSDVYPQGLKTNDIHLEGQMWSSALMEIWDVLGRNKTDILMLETLYSLGPNLTMTQAAKIFIKTDSLIYKGADVYTIAHYFIKRGFLPDSFLSIAPANNQVAFRIVTSQFAASGKVLMDFGDMQNGTMTLYDVTGKEFASQIISNTDHVEFNAPQIAGGIYILSVTTNGMHRSVKLMR
jgi:hypothetical protein